MRWITFSVCALVMVTLQSAVAPRMSVLGVRPDWLLVAVVFFALYVPLVDALLAAWIIGACADLMGLERFGLLSISYGLVAVLVFSVRDYLFRYQGTTQFCITLIACFLVRALWAPYLVWMYPQADWGFGSLLLEGMATALYTALFAPFLHKFGVGMAGAFGLPKRRYTYSGSIRIDTASV